METPIDTGQGMRVTAPAVLPEGPPMPARAGAVDGCPSEIPCLSVELTEHEKTTFLKAMQERRPPDEPLDRPSSEGRAYFQPHPLPRDCANDA